MLIKMFLDLGWLRWAGSLGRFQPQGEAYGGLLKLRCHLKRGLLRPLDQIPQRPQQHLAQQVPIGRDPRQCFRYLEANVESVPAQHLLKERKHTLNDIAHPGVTVGLGQSGSLQPQQFQLPEGITFEKTVAFAFGVKP